MIKIIAIILLATGSALVVCGVLIFILSDLRSVLKDLSTTRKLEVDSGIDDAVQEAYYSESYAPDVAEEKPKMKGFIRRKSAQSSETSMLSDVNKTGDTQEKERERVVDAQPLETLRETLSETAPLSAAGKSGTQPLHQEDIPEGKGSGSVQKISGGEPLHQQLVPETQPLYGGQPMSQTQPLPSIGQPVSETQPLYQKPVEDTQPLGRAQEALHRPKENPRLSPSRAFPGSNI